MKDEQGKISESVENPSLSDSKAKGGYARAKRLSPGERSEIAKNAALSRWNQNILIATHEGVIRVGVADISCAVLEDGIRVLTQTDILKALGRAPRVMGIRDREAFEQTPPFLRGKSLKPFISEELIAASSPIKFRTPKGNIASGYRAELLPQICEVFLTAREKGVLPHNQKHIATQCEILVRGLARVGIIALVDEATGYQEVRDRRALEAILDRFLRKELATWAKRFPDEFYQEIFRLKSWEWRGMSVNRPSVVGKYTTDLVYDRLAPGIVDELQKLNPKNDRGKRKHRHHQWLTEDVGHPALAQHLYGLIGFMRVSDDWDTFYRMVQRAYPRKNTTMLLPGGDASF